MQVRARFWLEGVLATLTTGLFIVTLLSRDWIERIFHVEPDAGNGTLEWLIVTVLLVASLALMVAARTEWRRAQTAAN